MRANTDNTVHRTEALDMGPAGPGREAPRTLDRLRPGDRAVIDRIGDSRARAMAMRFGMADGASVRCITTLPGGPVVLGLGRQEIAVGRGLARQITLAGVTP